MERPFVFGHELRIKGIGSGGDHVGERSSFGELLCGVSWRDLAWTERATGDFVLLCGAFDVE